MPEVKAISKILVNGGILGLDYTEVANRAIQSAKDFRQDI